MCTFRYYKQLINSELINHKTRLKRILDFSSVPPFFYYFIFACDKTHYYVKMLLYCRFF